MPITNAALGTCSWAIRSELELTYHDAEWGRPCYDEQRLFEYLILDTFQAGLNWRIILQKREAFRRVFAGFNPEVMANLSDAELAALCMNASIIRSIGKLKGARKNAQALLRMHEQGTSLSDWMWMLAGDTPQVNRPSTPADVPVTTPTSDAISKALIKAGFGYCGSTTTYALMQAAGMVCDHLITCSCHPDNLPR